MYLCKDFTLHAAEKRRQYMRRNYSGSVYYGSAGAHCLQQRSPTRGAAAPTAVSIYSSDDNDLFINRHRMTAFYWCRGDQGTGKSVPAIFNEKKSDLSNIKLVYCRCSVALAFC